MKNNVYTVLMRAIYSVFDSDVFPNDTLTSIQNTFVNGFTNIIKTTIETNIDYSKLDLSISSLRNREKNSFYVLQKLIAESVDNQNSYFIFNYFLVSFIEVLIKNAPISKKPIIETIFNGIGLNEEVFLQVKSNYDEYICRRTASI